MRLSKHPKHSKVKVVLLRYRLTCMITAVIAGVTLVAEPVFALGPTLTTRPSGSTPAAVGALPVDPAISNLPAEAFGEAKQHTGSCTFPNVLAPNGSTIKHVAPCQTGTGNGSATSPWRTIREAMTNLNPGEVAYIHDSPTHLVDYTENNLTQGKDGTGANTRIRLMGAPGEAKPVITEPSNAAQDTSIFHLTRPWWIIEGLHIRGSGVDLRAPVIRVGGTGARANYLVLRNMLATQTFETKAFFSFEGATNTALLDTELGEALDANKRPARLPADKVDHHAIQVAGGSNRILIRGNSSYGHNGDSFQCGEESTTTNPMPTDITVENNRFHHDEENAIDIKACQGVTIRDNKMYGYRPARPMPSDRAPQGDAVVIHLATTTGRASGRILVEQNRLWDNSRAINVHPAAVSTVIRRNVIFNANADPTTCSMGAGMALGGKKVEAYHNTLDNLPAPSSLPSNCYEPQSLGSQTQALRVGSSAGSNMVLWNNIVSNATMPYVTTGSLTLDANKNLFKQSFSGMPPNSLTGDPLYVDRPVDNDYFTRQGSPARDKAQPVSASVHDPAVYCDDPTPSEGNLIAQPDIGFLESCQ